MGDELVEYLHYKAPNREFVIYSGRHGDLPNQYKVDTHENIANFQKEEKGGDGSGLEFYLWDLERAERLKKIYSKDGKRKRGTFNSNKLPEYNLNPLKISVVDVRCIPGAKKYKD